MHGSCLPQAARTLDVLAAPPLPPHLVQLLLQRVVVVDDAHASHAGHGHSHARLGHLRQGRAGTARRVWPCTGAAQPAARQAGSRQAGRQAGSNDPATAASRQLVHCQLLPRRPQASASASACQCLACRRAHRVHRRRHQRRAQPDVARHIAGQVHLSVVVGAGVVGAVACVHNRRLWMKEPRRWRRLAAQAAGSRSPTPGPHLVRPKMDVAWQEDDVVVRVAGALAKQLGRGVACTQQQAGGQPAAGGRRRRRAAAGVAAGAAQPALDADGFSQIGTSTMLGARGPQDSMQTAPHRPQCCRQRRGARSRYPL